MHHPIFADKPWLSAGPMQDSPVGMLGDHEAAMFYTMAKEVFSGHGTIVDAGSFVGKSAFHFACGLRSNPEFIAERDKIHCFDLFQVGHSSTVDFFRKRLGVAIHMGDSTRDVFERQVAPVRDVLEVYEGDLHVVPWTRQPIEILMVDVAKTASLGSRVIELFFPDLIPGASYVIHQDYHHAWHPYIQVVMSYLADYFDIVATRVDASAAFLLKKEIPDEVLQRAIRYDFSAEERARLMDAAITRLPACDRPTVELARLVTNTENVPAADALAALTDFEKEHAGLQDDAFLAREVGKVRDHLLEKDGWQQQGNRRPDLVLQRAEELMAQGRSGWSVLSLRGAALRALGRLTDAEQDLRASVTANPHNCFSTTELAAVLAAQGRSDDAVAELSRGLSDSNPTEAECRRYYDALGLVLLQSGNADWCCEVMDRLSASLDHQAEFWALYARVNAFADRREQAAENLGTAVVRGLSANRRAEVEKLLGIDAPQG